MKNYWNKIANQKTFTHPFNIVEFSKHVTKESCILDYGCGQGRILGELYDHGYKNLLGVDYSKNMIAVSKNTFPDINFIQNKGDTIPLPTHSLDAVILFAVLTCIATDKNQYSLMREIERVLKPNGFLYISDYPIQKDERNITRYQSFEKKYKKYGVFELSSQGIFRHHDAKHMAVLLKNFQQIFYKEINLITMNGNPAVAFQFIGKLKNLKF